MMRQKREYRRINQATALDAIRAEAQGQSAAARMSVSMGIRTRTMMDKSTRNLATMLAEGSSQGVLDCKRAERLSLRQPRCEEALPGTGRIPIVGRGDLAGVCLKFVWIMCCHPGPAHPAAGPFYYGILPL